MDTKKNVIVQTLFCHYVNTHLNVQNDLSDIADVISVYKCSSLWTSESLSNI
jgi:hypothetical protein